MEYSLNQMYSVNHNTFNGGVGYCFGEREVIGGPKTCSQKEKSLHKPSGVPKSASRGPMGELPVSIAGDVRASLTTGGQWRNYPPEIDADDAWAFSDDDLVDLDDCGVLPSVRKESDNTRPGVARAEHSSPSRLENLSYARTTKEHVAPHNNTRASIEPLKSNPPKQDDPSDITPTLPVGPTMGPKAHGKDRRTAALAKKLVKIMNRSATAEHEEERVAMDKAKEQQTRRIINKAGRDGQKKGGKRKAGKAKGGEKKKQQRARKGKVSKAVPDVTSSDEETEAGNEATQASNEANKMCGEARQRESSASLMEVVNDGGGGRK
jgi:hypothetical protein